MVAAGRHLAPESRPLITPRRRGGVGGWQRRGGSSGSPRVSGSPHRAPRLSSAVPPGLLGRPGSSPGAPPRGSRVGGTQEAAGAELEGAPRLETQALTRGSRPLPTSRGAKAPSADPVYGRPRAPSPPSSPPAPTGPAPPPHPPAPSCPALSSPGPAPAPPLAPPPPSNPSGPQSLAPPHWPAGSTDLPTPRPPGLEDPQESLRGPRQVASDSTGTHHSHGTADHGAQEGGESAHAQFLLPPRLAGDGA